MKKMLVILGPTATGKTDLAIDLAKKLNGELVSVDSRQVYRGLDIGTGKAPSGGISNNYQFQISNAQYEKGEGYWKMGGVRVWMYDVADLKDRYHVSQYVKDAENAIQNIIKEGKLPILVGGTGLYLKGLLEGFPTLNLGVDEKLREKLEKSGVGELQKKLHSLSPTIFEQMNESDKKNSRRLIRQIEIFANHFPISNFKFQISNDSADSEPASRGGQARMTRQADILKIGLSAPRPVLNARIDQRVLSRFEKGMLEEAKQLLKDGLSIERMKSLGLEYRVQAEFLNGEITYRQMVEKLQNKIHQYAKHQLTWFKKDRQINWFDITANDWDKKVVKRVKDWYNVGA